MTEVIQTQRRRHRIFYALFGLVSVGLLWYYLSYTLIHFTTPQQFAINSFVRFPLTYVIFPAEVFSALFALYFIYNLFTDIERPVPKGKLPGRARTRVAILLPVYNEPKHIVERTVRACRALTWAGGVRIYILDDSSSEEDKRNMEALARKYRCELVRRPDRTGYKAGNINHGVRAAVQEKYFVIFDADHAPLPAFLDETMDFFSDPSVGFVQAPQYFVDERTPLERAAKVGTNIFYHSQCVSKARDGAMPFCGTNVVVRTDVFVRVGGFAYYTATEDIELGLRINQEGFRGVYVPKILVHGYAPPNFSSYASQQYRWANGNLAILRESWLKLLAGRFSLRYQMPTFFTLGWWLIGVATLTYILVPILSLVLGTGTHHAWLPTGLLVLLYFNVVMGISMIYVSLRGRISERVTFGDALLQYSLLTNSAFIYARAALGALLKRYVGFVRTEKKRVATGLRLIRLNLLLSALCFGFSVYALYHAAVATSVEQLRTFLPISVWLLFYSVVLASAILFVGAPAVAEAAAPVPVAETERKGVGA